MPDIPESMKAPTITIMTGLRKQFPSVPEDRFKEVVTTELARAAIEFAQLKKAPSPEQVKKSATELAERIRKLLKEELS